jgi:ATP-dependent exoDNAse (exonuclease V) beta subunit
MLYPILKNINAHKRDLNICFFEDGHRYEISSDIENKYTSVTTWIHSHFPHFNPDEIIQKMMNGKGWREGHKYWNMTIEEIKNKWNENGNNVSGLGTAIHFEIECFMNNPLLKEYYTHKELLEEYNKQINSDVKTPEWNYFIQFISEKSQLKPYRTEWIIYHEELKLAGSIDMVYENSDGTLSIYDWKRCKNITPVNNFNKYALTYSISHMPDSNFWHYALQLNVYKAILEEKYDKKVKELYLVRLYPDNEDNTYELIRIPFLENEIKDLFCERKLYVEYLKK